MEIFINVALPIVLLLGRIKTICDNIQTETDAKANTTHAKRRRIDVSQLEVHYFLRAVLKTITGSI